MRETAYAKVNLALHVRAREPAGYHRIETVFAFCEDGDTIEAITGEGISLELTGAFAGAVGSVADNLVMRAASQLHQRMSFHRARSGFVRRGVRLRLEKNLPVASGIGGGSADAAAALRLLARWWQLPEDPAVMHEIARKLGSDVPACLASRTARGEGRGDDLCDVDGASLSGRPILLVNPLVAMPTGPVFASWDGVDRGPLGDGLTGRNDLLEPARHIAPVIDEVLAALATGQASGMSGSGATCFALFETASQCHAAKEDIAAAHPDWWTLQSCLR